MHLLKYFFIVAISLFAMIGFVSCDENKQWGGAAGSTYTSNSYSDNNDSSANSNKESHNDSASEKKPQIELKQSQQHEQDAIIESLTLKINNLETKSKRSIEASTVYALLMFEMIAFLLLFFVLYRKINKAKHTSHENVYEEHDIPRNKVRLMVESEFDTFAQRSGLISIRDRLSTIEQRIAKLEPKSNPAYSGYPPTQSTNNNSHATPAPSSLGTKKSSASSNTFYMPRTRNPMRFDDSKKVNTRSENTYFKFTLVNANKASFVFDPYDDTCIQRAFDDRDNSLATVCDIELINSQPTSCKNVTPGQAELKDGFWEVTNKLKLQYV